MLVDAGEYLEALSRYIHLNPVRAGIEHYAWDYPWSSCRYFVGSQRPPDWLEVNRILAGFSRNRRVARQRYEAYLSEADQVNPFEDLVGGSLLGPELFIEWIKNTFLSGKKTYREIPQLLKRVVLPIIEFYAVFLAPFDGDLL